MRIFWPVFLGVALVCAVVVWIAAPSMRTSVPEGLRASWANGIAAVNGVDLEQMESEQIERMNAEIEAARAREAAAAATTKPSEMQVRSRPKADVNRKSEPVAQSQAPRAQEAQPAYTPPAPAPVVEDPIPSTRGILQTDYKDATWGIVNAVVPYRSLADGEEMGKAAVGAVFAVEQRQPADGGGVDFIGNFINKPIEEPVLISASKLYCFTGSYDSLTQRQKAALQAYYKKRAEAERLKREISLEIGSKSPHFAKAVEAKAKWDEMVKTAEKLEVALRTDKKANASQIREKLARMKGEMAVQQAKVKDLSAKHKAWKEKNSTQIGDPEDDPRLQKLRAEMQGFAKAVPDLAF